MSDEEFHNLGSIPFMKHNGISLRENGSGTFSTYIDVEDYQCNPYGVVHGGELYTMADICGGVNVRSQSGRKAVTMDSDFHYLTNVSSGRIEAEAETIRMGSSVAVMSVKVKSEAGTLLAFGTFSYFFLD